ncbi:MAG: hypothetical protein NXI04_13715 [Planctomycetaceae bacterium]|nr:hypothetical protein [Planctomycetaceae bacterium]
MSQDNPFTAPAQPHNVDDDLSTVRVEGDLLLCGRQVDLSHICWLTGDRTSVRERRNTDRLRLHCWPGSVRGLLWIPVVLLSGGVFLMPDELPLSVFVLLFCSVVLLSDVVVAWFIPTTRLTIAYSRRGRALKSKRFFRDVLRYAPAIGLALLIWTVVEGIDTPFPESLNGLLFVVAIILLMWLQKRAFPPKQPRRSLVARQTSAGVFVIEHAPAEFLAGLQGWLDETGHPIDDVENPGG